MRKNGPAGAEFAETLALHALAWLVGNHELLSVFLGATGTSAEELRARAAVSRFACAKRVAQDVARIALRHQPQPRTRVQPVLHVHRHVHRFLEAERRVIEGRSAGQVSDVQDGEC